MDGLLLSETTAKFTTIRHGHCSNDKKGFRNVSFYWFADCMFFYCREQKYDV